MAQTLMNAFTIAYMKRVTEINVSVRALANIR